MKYSSLNCLSILVLILLFSGNFFAQQPGGDKVRLLISKEKNDTSKIKLLIDFALNYTRNDQEEDSCLKIVYDLSRIKKYRYGLAFGRYYEGLQLAGSGRYDEAIEKMKTCIDELDAMHCIQTFHCPLAEIRI
jgi:hypothetical protein